MGKQKNKQKHPWKKDRTHWYSIRIDSSNRTHWYSIRIHELLGDTRFWILCTNRNDYTCTILHNNYIQLESIRYSTTCCTCLRGPVRRAEWPWFEALALPRAPWVLATASPRSAIHYDRQSSCLVIKATDRPRPLDIQTSYFPLLKATNVRNCLTLTNHHVIPIMHANRENWFAGKCANIIKYKHIPPGSTTSLDPDTEAVGALGFSNSWTASPPKKQGHVST